MNFFRTLALGGRYMEIWPDEPALGAIFPENRVKYMMGWGRLLIPPAAVFVLLWVYVQGGGLHGISWLYTLQANWPLAMMCILLLALLPVQGYYWFGRRAQLPLQRRQADIYRQLCGQLEREPAAAPSMYDLALVLREGFRRLGREFLDSL